VTLRRVELGSGTRVPDGVITADALAVVWPEVSRRLTRLLASRGAAHDVTDDIVQEVAARVLSRGIVFEDAADLMRWTVPVALNLLVDHARATKRVAVGGDVDTTVPDIADVVVDRDRLGRVLGAVAQLSDGDRAALVASGLPAADRRESVRLAVRRHRARRRLLAIVDGAAGIAAWLGLRLRRARGGALTASVALALPVGMFVDLPGDVRPALPPGVQAAAPAALPGLIRLDAATSHRPAYAVGTARPVARRAARRATPVRHEAAPATTGRRGTARTRRTSGSTSATHRTATGWSAYAVPASSTTSACSPDSRQEASPRRPRAGGGTASARGTTSPAPTRRPARS
jgi:DNA-directed RNA polymerase specialized sigma24 family protein